MGTPRLQLLLSVLLVLVLLVTIPCIQSVFIPGQCPTDRPIVKNFDAKRYSGLWFEYARKSESYEFLGDCNTVTYTAHENNTIGIKEYRLLADPEREVTEETYAVYAHPEQQPLEGRWNISYQWNTPFFENHRIMETDYDSYSITYICIPAGPEYSTDEFVIYTREPTVSPELEMKLMQTVAQHYSLQLMFKPRQTDCKGRVSNTLYHKLVFSQ